MKGQSLPIRIISSTKKGPTLIQCSIQDPTPLKKSTRIAISKRNEVNAPLTFLITLQSSTNIPLQSKTKISLQSSTNIHLQSSTKIPLQSSTNIPSSISQLTTSTNQDQVVMGTPVSQINFSAIQYHTKLQSFLMLTLTFKRVLIKDCRFNAMKIRKYLQKDALAQF